MKDFTHVDPRTADDEQLLAWLGALAAVVDPEPVELRELGRAAFTVRRIDAELAELVSDSALLGGLVRSAGSGPRLLSFAAGDLVIELQVDEAPAGLGALGVIDGLEQPVPADARVDLETADARVLSSPLDELGRFGFTTVPAGLVRARVVAGELDVTTAWVRLDSEFRHPTP